jgi:broad-specificity NMP kinase
MKLVFIFGLFNTGKTTLAQALGSELGYDVMSADAVRIWLGCPPESSSDTLVLSAMSDSIEWHRAQDRDLIVESEGTWPRVKQLLNAGTYEDITRVVILLEATERVREQRDAIRAERLRPLGWGIRAPLDAAAFAQEHHRIDTTSATLEEVLAIASQIIRHATADNPRAKR